MTETAEHTLMTDNQTLDRQKEATGISLPVFMLTLLGTVITVLGLFVAGEIGLVIVGLASVAVAGLIHIFATKE